MNLSATRLLIKKIVTPTISRTVYTSFYKDVPLSSMSAPEFILENVEKFGDKTAILDDISKATYTYRDVLQITKNISSGLVKHQQLQKGDVVSIILPNMPEYLFAMLGIMSTGATASLSNPIMPANDIKYQIELSNSKVIVTATPFLSTVLEAIKGLQFVKAVYLVDANHPSQHRSFHDELMNDKGDASTFGKLSLNVKEDVCLMPYSSGTTGLPKGVMLTHSNITSNLQQYRAVKDLDEGNENYLLQLPLFHIYGFQVIASMGLRHGLRLITSPKFLPGEFLPLVEKSKITLLHLVPPQVLFLLSRNDLDEYDLSSLNEVLVGAAPIDQESQEILFEKMSKLSPNFDIIQGYGMTETSPVIACMPPRQQRKSGKRKSVGVILPNTMVKFVDSDGDEVKTGEVGELVAKGPQVMKGYINNPEATQNCVKEGWIYTGDLGYIDEDGYIFIEDRLKELIKYKGFQVPPAELEGILISHPKIFQACVVGKPDREAGELPHAFVKKEGDLTEQEVEDFVAERVAGYKKLRGGVTFVDSIPCSQSGKILRRQLRQLLY